MDYETHLQAMARELTALTDALAAGPMDTQVPTCPEWTTRDLAAHIGQFAHFWSHVISEGAGTEKRAFPALPDGDGVPQWVSECGHALVAQLTATQPTQTMWSWVPGQGNAAFVARRGSHELAIHRFDAQAARGTTTPVDSALAVDGIEEIFVMAEAWAAEHPETGKGDGETLCLSATDQPAAWLIALTPEGVVVAREAGPADLSLEGPASDLELLLYQRPLIGTVLRRGDRSALAAWYRAFSFG